MNAQKMNRTVALLVLITICSKQSFCSDSLAALKTVDSSLPRVAASVAGVSFCSREGLESQSHLIYSSLRSRQLLILDFITVGFSFELYFLSKMIAVQTSVPFTAGYGHVSNILLLAVNRGPPVPALTHTRR